MQLLDGFEIVLIRVDLVYLGYLLHAVDVSSKLNLQQIASF